MSSRIQTAFIGAISRFEEHFGHLWGHGLTEAECNNDQRELRAAWYECRDSILDQGNKLLRAERNQQTSQS